MLQETSQYILRRSLVVEDEDCERMYLGHVDFSSDISQVEVAQTLRSLVGELNRRQVRVYHFSKQAYLPVNSDRCQVPLEFISGAEGGMFLVKIRGEAESACSTSSIASHERVEIASVSSSIKRERSKQRVIFEVVEIVKRWRQLHLSRNSPRKVSLQEAAKLVGLPKKSLDDYYYQLRLGEKYGFDFKAHLFERVGVLRTYLKGLKESSKLDKTQKHPKRLKIIDEFELLSQIYSAQRQMLNLDHPRMEQEMAMKEQEGNEWGEVIDAANIESAQDDQISLQDHFYNQFEYMLNDKDPFLAYDFNFKKKGIEENSEEELFF